MVTTAFSWRRISGDPDARSALGGKMNAGRLERAVVSKSGEVGRGEPQ
jgi:hypothetical protein